MKRPWQALRAVFAAFVGIRHSDAANVDRELGFADIVTAAIVLLALLVGLLLGLVWLLTG